MKLYDRIINEGLGLTITKLRTPGPTLVANLPQFVDEESLFNYLGISAKAAWYYVRFPQYSTFYLDKQTKVAYKKLDGRERALTEMTGFGSDVYMSMAAYKEFRDTGTVSALADMTGVKLREIQAPANGLTEVHRRLNTLFYKLPIHGANYAYVKGSSYIMAAKMHKDGEVLIRIDLKDFFLSHRVPLIVKGLQRVTGWTEQVCWVIAKLCTLDGKMPQGTASSPILSIVLNYAIDVAIAELAASYNLVYTRYSDDLCFSGVDRRNSNVWEFINAIAHIIKPFNINWDKVNIMRHTTRRVDTGGEGLKPIYAQSIKRILGVHLTVPGEIKYPRYKYNQLRLDAMLYARDAVGINKARFRGRLANLRQVDPGKAATIDSIVLKFKELKTNTAESVTEELARIEALVLDGGEQVDAETA